MIRGRLRCLYIKYNINRQFALNPIYNVEVKAGDGGSYKSPHSHTANTATCNIRYKRSRSVCCTRCAQNIFHLLADRSQWRAATKQNVVESIRTVFALQRIPILHTTAHGFCTNLRSQLTAYSLSLSLWFNWRSQQLSFTPFLFLLVYTNGLPYCVHSPTHPNAVCYGFQRHRMCSSILSISI